MSELVFDELRWGVKTAGRSLTGGVLLELLAQLRCTLSPLSINPGWAAMSSITPRLENESNPSVALTRSECHKTMLMEMEVMKEKT